MAITGAIAAGASTLAGVLHKTLGWQRYEDEQVAQANKFFTDAYSNFQRWGFHSQVNFMTASAERHHLLYKSLTQGDRTDPPIVEDRTPFEHKEGYLQAYNSLGLIPTREYDLLNRLAKTLEQHYVVPDVLVFRRMSDEQFISRVRDRSRPGEETASIEFLNSVRKAFDLMIQQWQRSTVVIVDSDVDILDPRQGELVAQQIMHALIDCS